MGQTDAAGKLVVVLGDQLTLDSAAFDGFDPAHDVVWMAEVDAEAEYVWSSKARLAIFLSAMRHFRRTLEREGYRVRYRTLDDPANLGSLDAELDAAVSELRPRTVIVVQPGEHRVETLVRELARRRGFELDIRPDRSFLCTREQFAEHLAGRKQPRMEYFYREMRRRLDVLIDDGGPTGGTWNFDKANRRHFGADGPGAVGRPRSFAPDAITAEVLALVAERFADHPGGLEHFDWPVTAADADAALADFIDTRLGLFGDFEDAMWTGEPYLYHSRLSSCFNLKLLSPRKAVDAAAAALKAGNAEINSVEGFIRQILGWREYVRGVYWACMPAYLDGNALSARRPLPGFYWTGAVDAACLRHTITQTLDYGYAHHIQRLMVTGLFALLAGVDPRQVHMWYLAVYVDAVEWVELPNVLGMSQFADGGIMASKPYCATGKYIDRMSNYCRQCRYDPGASTGETACPFTTLYWDFLLRHRDTLAGNPRMGLQMRNLDRLNRGEKAAVRRRANSVRNNL